MFIEKNCIECLKPIKDITKNRNKKYCSKICSQKVSNRNYPLTKRGRFKTAKKESTRKRNSEKIHRKWTLNEDEYWSLVKDNECHYCKGNLPKYGAGLDRVDNSKGYQLGNVVPCCKNCNTLRFNNITPKELKEVLKVLKKLRGGIIWKF